MSILPSSISHNQASTSTSSSPPPPPQPNHGGSVQSSSPNHGPFSGQVAAAEGYTAESSNEVSGRERWNHSKRPIHQDGGKTLHPEPAAAAQAAVGSSGKSAVSPSSYWSAAASTTRDSPRSTGHPTSKRTQMISGNHLLNFQYDPIPVSRPQPRPPPLRRQQRRRPYNKDLFFQANYKFVVLDSGNYALESMDPDKMLQWEDIICLKYSSPSPVQCPICLDDPLCPQITSCGHIFCFPCILQYFSLGEEDLRGECWKKCPLCFTMISSKDLFTIQIENVKQYHVGDEIDFVLLTRQKDSFSSSLRNKERISIDEEILDSFSKFTLTSDVELSVREAMSDLDSWIARADAGLVDDIEKLPYVCAAIKQLELRTKYWKQHRLSNDNKANVSVRGPPATINATDGNCSSSEPVGGTIPRIKNDKLKCFEKSATNEVVEECPSPQVADVSGCLEGHARSSTSSCNGNKNAEMDPNSVKDSKDGDSYNFYQVVDGQHLILHPLNMKCLLHHYGSYQRLPNRITGKILQLETVTQSEAMRRRYRFLSHLSLTTTFQLCEISLCDVLPVESLSPFMDEIKNRERQRKRLAKKEHKDKIKAEIAETQFVPVPYYSYDGSPSFSMDDFEALGGIAVASSSPPTVGERLSFSSVARLGFAAAHDSPALKMDENQTPTMTDLPHDSSSWTGLNNVGSVSFANITSRARPVEGPHNMGKVNEVGRKGKKPSRVLLSTSGGRRY